MVGDWVGAEQPVCSGGERLALGGCHSCVEGGGFEMGIVCQRTGRY